jgi:hypothetical protein
MNNSAGSGAQDAPFLRSRTLDLHINVWANSAYLRAIVCLVDDTATYSGSLLAQTRCKSPRRPNYTSSVSDSEILGNPHAASHQPPGLSYSSGAGDHDSFGSTTGALGTHSRFICWHPFEGAAVGGLYGHETHPVFELALALSTLQVDTLSFLPRWPCHACLSPSCTISRV